MTDMPNSITGANETPQIIAPDSPLPDQLWAAVRQAAPPIMAFALGREWITNDIAILLGVLGAIVWPIVQGQLVLRHKVNQLTNLANDRRVSDQIITTASKAATNMEP